MILVACLLIFVTVIFLLYSYIFNKEMTKRKIIIATGTISFAIIILCFHLDPPESFDLYRHFSEMSYMRGLNFQQSVQIIFGKSIFIWNLLERLIALIFNNNSFIFLVTIPITIIPFVFILIKMKDEYKMTSRQIVISILSFFSIINTMHLMSGIRNALAVAIYVIGLNLNVFKQKKIRLFILYNCSIHTSNGNYFARNGTND